MNTLISAAIFGAICVAAYALMVATTAAVMHAWQHPPWSSSRRRTSCALRGRGQAVPRDILTEIVADTGLGLGQQLWEAGSLLIGRRGKDGRGKG